MLDELVNKLHLERWKETPLKKILATKWVMGENKGDSLLNHILLPEDSISILLCNGCVDQRWFSDQRLPEGVLVQYDHEQLMIRIMKDTAVDKAIVIHHITQSTDDNPIYSKPKITVELEEGANASLVFIESGMGHYLTQPEMMVRVQKTARLEWVKVSLNASDSNSLYDFTCVQEAQSHVAVISYQSRGAIIRSDLHFQSLGENSHTEFIALNLGKGTQHLAHVIDLDHVVPNCTSGQEIKNLLTDHAETLFDGRIHVHQDAQKTDADQLTRSILLSDHARSMTIPRLEIYADDVRCTHGATIGFLEPDELFYLRSRGIDLENARAILMRAYATEVINKIEHGAIHSWLSHILEEDLKTIK